MTPFPPVLKARAIQRWRDGDMLDEITEDLGCSRGSIRNWTRGMKRDHRARRHSGTVRRYAVDLYVERKLSSTAVAEIMGDGIAAHTVRTWVRQAGKKLRTRWGKQ